ncbi:WD_REPEATS_REGION domain-containing protein [Haematococcus lacustris]|uniref:WD_REPEATS_REGION domain-containing protein n=1 Tax=Haematococcus lacustris TaxID=44745 RepID=A0A699YQE8_HAELA|nr:WD_REPEATS_REGION domain-containing protein [Haematococcus lacustris]
MQLRYLKTVLPPGDGLQKVTSLCWAANNSKMAAVTTDKVVYLFDDNGERKDKFKTKPADASGSANYIVRAMAFSPDSTKLAIAQSDNIVFIYRLGESWTDKKSICNKFLQSSPITCMIWPRGRDDVVFGLADGKVKLGMLKTGKAYTLYAHPDSSYVVSLAASPNGQAVVCGHIDGAIYRFTFPQEEGGAGLSSSQLVQHSSVPYALGWGACIAAAGNDNRVVFYDTNGRELQVFDYSNDEAVREFTSCSFNPSGDTAAFGSYNRFYIYTLNATRKAWEQIFTLPLP